MIEAVSYWFEVAISEQTSARQTVVRYAAAMALLFNQCAWAETNAMALPPNQTAAHWSFQPLKKIDPPAVKKVEWARTAVDRFILARLEERGLQPAPTAGKRTLIRRATFDLIGLPPTPEEVDAFLDDGSPNAFEKVIERLLNSPHYGERWGRHWLDIARYADNKGYVFFEEKSYPWAWVYRDYVVRSFNEDKPFDRFVLEQTSRGGQEFDIKLIDTVILAAVKVFTQSMLPLPIATCG